MKIIIIQQNNLHKNINVKNNQLSLLDILKKYNINISYQCEEGYCGTCRILLIKGTVHYYKSIFPTAICNDNEIIPCCCIIKSNITIKCNL